MLLQKSEVCLKGQQEFKSLPQRHLKVVIVMIDDAIYWLSWLGFMIITLASVGADREDLAWTSVGLWILTIFSFKIYWRHKSSQKN